MYLSQNPFYKLMSLCFAFNQRLRLISRTTGTHTDTVENANNFTEEAQRRKLFTRNLLFYIKMHQLIYNPCWILKYNWEQAEALSSEHHESTLQMTACVCVSIWCERRHG